VFRFTLTRLLLTFFFAKETVDLALKGYFVLPLRQEQGQESGMNCVVFTAGALIAELMAQCIRERFKCFRKQQLPKVLSPTLALFTCLATAGRGVNICNGQ
jgi:hypothetical protein